MRRTIAALAALSLLLVLTGCGVPAAVRGAKRLTAAKKPEPADMVPVGEGGYAALGRLGTALLAGAEGENPAVSPLSAYVALSMAAEGAAGQTRAELDALLGENARDVCRLTLSRLREEKENTVLGADAAWVVGDAPILPEYLDVLARLYGAEAYETGLDPAPMNRWVSARTKGLIDGIFTEPLPDDTRLVLLDTLYMKAAWDIPFEKDLTRDGDFFLENGGTCPAHFMVRTGRMSLLEGEGYEGVLLFYKGYGLSFSAVKPTNGSARELLATFRETGLPVSGGNSANITLRLPRFETDCANDLTDSLKTMGCAAAFDPKAADFSGMCREEPLFISLVKQRVHVIVNEEGTEAAAATAIGMASGSAAPEKPREIRFDEPFIYWVMDRNGAVLFIGIVDDPA